jgi:uncharacterized protein YndB with AHSA1/START domain
MAVATQSVIKQEVIIRAPRSRVWKALTTVSELSTWFRCTLNTKEFHPGDIVNGESTYPGHEGTAFTLEIVETAPEQRFSWRWHPGHADVGDPPTTVTFTLEDVPGGTLVRVTESGFDRISLERRAKAFEGNTQGWAIQMQNLQSYAESKR